MIRVARAVAVLVIVAPYAVACGSERGGATDEDAGAVTRIVADASASGGGDETGTLDADAGDNAGDASLRVLFVGNSYTYVNDLPGMLVRIAASGGTTSIATDEVVQGGATLADHLQNGIAQAKMADGGFTHVVVQGQSLEPALNGSFLGDLTRFGDLALAAGARPTWFVTWARAPGDVEYDPTVGDFSGPAEMQDRLTSAYADGSRLVPGSLLSCVGEAFRASLRDHPAIVLHQSDDSHPSVAGTYLAACTFYVALTGKSVPERSEVPAGVGADVAAALRETAKVGSRCADVQAKSTVAFAGDRDGPDGGPPRDFGAAGTAIPGTFLVTNQGPQVVSLDDGKTLAPPFAWSAGGAYPGGTGTTNGTPFCTTTLAAGKQCALSVSFSGTSTGTGRLTIGVGNAYQTSLSRSLFGTSISTDRPLVTVSESPGFLGCTDARCGPATFALLRGATQPAIRLLVTNRGGATAVSLGAGAPLDAPFTWGAALGFPGGSGVGTLGGDAYPYCTASLAPGQQCLVTFDFPPPQPVQFYATTLDVTYSDPQGALPDATRKVTAYLREAILSVSEDIGANPCSDATCGPAQLPAVRVGETAVLNLLVTSRGTPPTSLGEGVPLAPPFYWGASGTGGTFPGGVGQGTIAGQNVRYCDLLKRPGNVPFSEFPCMLTIHFSPTSAGLFAGAVNLAYADEGGAVVPSANRNIAARADAP